MFTVFFTINKTLAFPVIDASLKFCGGMTWFCIVATFIDEKSFGLPKVLKIKLWR